MALKSETNGLAGDLQTPASDPPTTRAALGVTFQQDGWQT